MVWMLSSKPNDDRDAMQLAFELINKTLITQRVGDVFNTNETTDIVVFYSLFWGGTQTLVFVGGQMNRHCATLNDLSQSLHLTIKNKSNSK